MRASDAFPAVLSPDDPSQIMSTACPSTRSDRRKNCAMQRHKHMGHLT
jgi:hypothetical protein